MSFFHGARRPSAPSSGAVSPAVRWARPRANSAPVTDHGTVGRSEVFCPGCREGTRARHASDAGLSEKYLLLAQTLHESPEHSARAIWDCPPTITEEKDELTPDSSLTDLCKSEDSIITSERLLDKLAHLHELPPLRGTEMSRAFWNWMSMYRIIFALVFMANIIAVIFTPSLSTMTYSDAATAASINICIAILVRNEHTVNTLFRMACYLKPSTPLSIRRIAAKVYSYGGLHSGCAVAGTIWYITSCVLMTYNFKGPYKWTLSALSITICVLLCSIACLAMPSFRAAHHNTFERVHRFAGWLAIIFLWFQLCVSAASESSTTDQAFGSIIIRTPLFWCLTIITTAIFYPWSRLRLRPVHVQVLSPRAALLHFDYKKMDTCLGVRLTDSPLKETHSFATMSSAIDDTSFRVLMSRAGDWTSSIIDHPPTKIWVKGAPIFGVLRVALMFRKVLVVTTGTGIGPCLSLLESVPEHPLHVLWMGSKPRASYGDTIINSVYNADPGACIVDTSQAGRGDIVALAYSQFVESDAEAVVIISNPAVTRTVVEGLEVRGIPVYGAIFDS